MRAQIRHHPSRRFKAVLFKIRPARLLEILLSPDNFDYLTKDWDATFLSHYNQEEQEVLSKLIVFGEYLGNGNMWCFHKDSKKIYYYDHDSRPNINGMFDNFYGYLKPLLIYTQGEMGQHVDGLEQEVEQIVIGLIGKDRVRVWQYYSGWD